MQVNWQGVYPALLTPFTSSDQVDIPLFEKNLAAQLDAGVHGLIIGGSLGEASTLRVEEKEKLVKSAKAFAGSRVPVLLNIAESVTADAIAQTQLAQKWGADGLMLLPPMRYKSDDRETAHYFKTVAQSTELPIMIYNNPVDYKIDFRPELFDQLIDCPNVQALKESSRDVTNLTRMLNRFGDRFKILCGVDTLAMEELCLGAHGWVAGLVDAFPKETVAIWNLVQKGELEHARSIYRWFMPLLELDIHPKLVQYIKLAAQEVGIGSEFVRAPRLTLVGEERARVLEVIHTALANRPVC
ncbi:MAG: dihydrodipicolinate synthase family protein [Chitinophagaceae bacterium]|jgi:4-hydroxy-tetrahydrodipicolinate synthase|nr:dihydrodipicolinate synthase family protein [Chitinophagaceae bacterium]NDB53715.1 dihydrodipicolinate synthase family protein [Chitinophagaceae bacterium]